MGASREGTVGSLLNVGGSKTRGPGEEPLGKEAIAARTIEVEKVAAGGTGEEGMVGGGDWG